MKDSPRDLSFAAVNDWVHDGPFYDDLLYLCLTLAAALERATGKPDVSQPVDLSAQMDREEGAEGHWAEHGDS